jgi:malonyl-CoA O-methyltransferase
MDTPQSLDFRRVAASFNRAAETYPAVSRLQAEIGERLLGRLDWLKIAPGLILDVGSGCGRLSRALSERYPQATVHGFDLALDMARQARDRLPAGNFVCADAARLPLPDARADLLVSNLMLQWCSDYPAVFAEFARLLKPDGILLFTTFGPDTLRELRASWAEVDALPHVSRFTDMHHLGDALLGAGLRHPVVDADWIKEYYPDPLAVMRHLKAMGAGNAATGRSRGLLGKNRLRRVIEAYENYREPAGLPATFEVIYGYAQGGQAALMPGETRIPMSGLGRFRELG